jgi:urease beta subunit
LRLAPPTTAVRYSDGTQRTARLVAPTATHEVLAEVDRVVEELEELR